MRRLRIIPVLLATLLWAAIALAGPATEAPQLMDPAAAATLIAEADADVLIVGHVHAPMQINIDRRMIVNPGALLRDTPQPIDVPMAGTFAVLELPSRDWRVYRAADGVEVEIVRRRV